MFANFEQEGVGCLVGTLWLFGLRVRVDDWSLYCYGRHVARAYSAVWDRLRSMRRVYGGELVDEFLLLLLDGSSLEVQITELSNDPFDVRLVLDAEH